MEQQDGLGKYVMTLSHQLRRRIDAGMASIGITGMQARVLHFILKEREGKECSSAILKWNSICAGLQQPVFCT